MLRKGHGGLYKERPKKGRKKKAKGEEERERSDQDCMKSCCCWMRHEWDDIRSDCDKFVMHENSILARQHAINHGSEEESSWIRMAEWNFETSETGAR